jgi:hypothetical protein
MFSFLMLVCYRGGAGLTPVPVTAMLGFEPARVVMRVFDGRICLRISLVRLGIVVSGVRDAFSMLPRNHDSASFVTLIEVAPPSGVLLTKDFKKSVSH